MSTPIFTAKQFTGTEFAGAADKADFANHLVRFILAGFPRSLFHKGFYERLSNTFGHIAEYNQAGFWSTWFSNPTAQQQFIKRALDCLPMGQPEFCWVDVERVVQRWIKDHLTEIGEVLVKSQLAFEEAVAKEKARRDGLKGAASQVFVVLARDNKVGSFGHNQYILRAEDDSTYLVHRNFSNPWQPGQRVQVPLDPLQHNGPDWGRVQCEAPQRLPSAPLKVLLQGFGPRAKKDVVHV
jgi:hypothetical protein